MAENRQYECCQASTFLRQQEAYCNISLYREGPGVVEHDGLLWVVGGRGSGGSVERYDSQMNTWEVMEEKLRYQEQEYTAVVIDRVV